MDSLVPARDRIYTQQNLATWKQIKFQADTLRPARISPTQGEATDSAFLFS